MDTISKGDNMSFDAQFEEFRPDVLAMFNRYLMVPVEEVDWERMEAEMRILVAAHFPPDVRFEAHFCVHTTFGPDIELLVTEKGAVRYVPE